MKSYSAERKAAVLQKMLSPTSLSVPELAKQEGISDVTLYHWRKQAIASGTMSAVTKKTAEGWSTESKLAAVVETALLSEVELSAYCREKGLYPDQIKGWKQACIVGQQTATQQKQIAGAQGRADQQRIRELERELRRKDKALAEADARTTVERPAPSNKLSKAEVQEVLDACHRPDTAHLPPTQIVPRLADEGVYLASESTFYRILKAEGMGARRGRAQPPRKVKLPTTHTATAANIVWSWDITYLPSPVRGQYYYPYLFENLLKNPG